VGTELPQRWLFVPADPDAVATDTTAAQIINAKFPNRPLQPDVRWIAHDRTARYQQENQR
jgi:hypothetical protein